MKTRSISIGDTFTAECLAGMTGYMRLRGEFKVTRITKAPVIYADGVGEIQRFSRDGKPRPEGPIKNNNRSLRLKLTPENKLHEVRKAGYGYSWHEA